MPRHLIQFYFLIIPLLSPTPLAFLNQPYVYESYSKSMRCTASSPPKRPRSLSAIQFIIKDALSLNLKVKAIGSLHSTSDIICTSGIVIDMSYINHLSFDPKTSTGVAGGGVKLGDFMDFIANHGRALTSSPVYSDITIGGALGTGAHGSSLEYAATISDQIVAITYVDGLGRIKRITEDDEDFRAFRVHLGLLGIIYEVVIRTVPQYKIKISNYLRSESFLFQNNGEELMRLINENRNGLHLFWFPSNKQVITSIVTKLDVSVPGNCETHLVTELPRRLGKPLSLFIEFIQLLGSDLSYFFIENYSKLSFLKPMMGFKTPLFTEPDGVTPCLGNVVGYSNKMLLNRCRECSWFNGTFLIDDYAVTIPLDELPGALRSLKEIFRASIGHFPASGIFLRFLKESDAYMGQSGNRDGVNIEWVTVPRYDRTKPKLGVMVYQAIAQALLEKHHGRAHWGKNGLYYTNPINIRRKFPDLEKFIKVMNKVDPEEVFMNDFGMRIKYGVETATVPEEMGVRCALNEVCLCKDDLDCGNGGRLDLTCEMFLDYKVCRKRPNLFLDEKDLASKRAIKIVAKLIKIFDKR